MFQLATRHRRIRRGAIVLALLPAAALVALSGCGGSSTVASAGSSSACPKQYNVTYQVYRASLVNTWADVAQTKGFFKKHCLTAKPVSVVSGPAALAQMAAGQIDFIKSSPDNLIQSRTKGLKVKIIANSAIRPSFAFVVAKKYLGGNPSFGEVMHRLSGQKIGVNALGTQMYYYARANFAAAGVPVDSPDYIAIGLGSSSLAALQNGSVAAAEMDSPTPDVAAALGYGREFADTRLPAAQAPDVPQAIRRLEGLASAWATSDDFIAKNPEAVKRFVAAMTDADKWVADKANRQALYNILEHAGELAIPANVPNHGKVFQHAIDLTAANTDTSGSVDMKALQNWISWTAEVRGISNPPSAREMVWKG